MSYSPWKILDHYFASDPYFMSKHHIDSFNDFISHKIPLTIKSLNPFIILKTLPDGRDLRIEVYIGQEDGSHWTLEPPTHPDTQNLLLPNEARIHDLTYAAILKADILVRYIFGGTVKDVVFKKQVLSKIPVMLHSNLCVLHNSHPQFRKDVGECPYDQGGYFIISGKEKVIVAQEHNAGNVIFVTKSSKPEFTYEGFIHCISSESVFPKTTKLYIYSHQYNSGIRANAIVVTVPHITLNTHIPLFVLFRALGITSDKEILQYICYDLETQKEMMEFLQASVVDGNIVYSQDQALAFLAPYVEYKTKEAVQYVLLNNLFPNIEQNNKARAFFLGHLVHKLIRTAMGALGETDRDNYMYKRINLSGSLMAGVFKDYYNAFRNHCRTRIDKEYETGPWKNSIAQLHNLVNNSNKNKFFVSDHLLGGMLKSMRGKWGLDGKEGIVQDLSRVSFSSFVSHLRRVNTPMDRSIKIVSPHRLNTSQWGVMCPVESPDGASIGLLKNMAMLCHITFDLDESIVRKCFEDLQEHMGIMVRYVKDIHPKDVHGATKVLVNFNWLAITSQPSDLVDVMRSCRRNNLLHPMISVSWDLLQNEIHILTDYGRCCRPLRIVNPKSNRCILDMHAAKLTFKEWSDYFKTDLEEITDKNRLTYADREYRALAKVFGNKIQDMKLRKLLEKHSCPLEFIDVQETNTSLIAMAPSDLAVQKNGLVNTYTHCEIHPCTMFSFYTSTIPFANHNQAPRNIFSGAQGKQAIGLYASSFTNRIDTMSYVLHYPQRPLVYTKFREYMDYNKLPNGENLIVAIATYTGYNQEDAVIINRASVERGLFNLTYYKAHVEEESLDPKSGERVLFGHPEKEGATIKQYADFGKIDEKGFPKLDAYIGKETVILGKVLTKQTLVEEGAEKGKLFTVKTQTENKFDKSTVSNKTMMGFIDKVVVYPSPSGEEGLCKCKIRMRKVRQPELGDKVASSHGQKGVIGAILPPENMPFTKDGIVPDLIVNPHAIPSRMTIGHLIESLLAKTGAVDGFLCDGTPFEPHDTDAIRKQLESHGFESQGNELLYNGFTGSQMHTDIFFAPTFYFRLKHMVADKINDRAQGPITSMTRQPTQGRGRDGGLRIGEMEENVLVAHGLSAFLKESFMERSDGYKTQIDRERGHITFKGEVPSSYDSSAASRDPPLAATYTAQVPFAFKQLVHELGAMSLQTYLISDQDNQEDASSDDDLEADAAYNDLYNKLQEEDPSDDEM